MSKQFNENPFKKNTQIIPFSNATEFETWQHENCHNCLDYESDSKTEQEAKCKLAFHLDFGCISGTIPLWVGKEIGINYNPLYQSGLIYSKCRKLKVDDLEMF